MASAALGCRLTEFFARNVTLVACQRLVLATQLEVGFGVVKPFFVQIHNFRHPDPR